MNEQRKLWLGIGAALLTSTSVQAVQPESFKAAVPTASSVMFLAGAVGEGGEGGEGGQNVSCPAWTCAGPSLGRDPVV